LDYGTIYDSTGVLLNHATLLNPCGASFTPAKPLLSIISARQTPMIFLPAKPLRPIIPSDIGCTSAGGHVDIWSVTLVTLLPTGERLRQNYDVFYEKEYTKGEKNKNSNTGRMALRMFLDPDRNPRQTGRSVLGDLAPKVTHLIFSGDTGNGFRGIPMSWYHSTLYAAYGLTCEQIPLSPRHAHNPTDAHFAHLNHFFRGCMRVTHLVGPEQFARALSLATDARCQAPRKLIKRTTVVYHRFLSSEYIPTPVWLEKTHPGPLSLSKLGYFLLSTTGDGGQEDLHPEGVMRVRQYAKRDEKTDPLFVWDMRKPAPGHEVCQRCSDREVSSSIMHVPHHVVTRSSHCNCQSCVPLGSSCACSHTRLRA
jgi:hypothetical protein